MQDEFDRQQTILYGVNEEFGTNTGMKNKSPMKINNNCISCSGNAKYAKLAFKIACLTYKESKIEYLGKSYLREDLHKKRI